MSNIWFTSDTHFGHKNIVRGCSSWENKDRCRDFDTLEEHNQVMVDNINAVVKQDDTLYHLGDWSFGGVKNIWEFRKQLNVAVIHFIPGNHDHHILKNRILPNVSKNSKTRELVDEPCQDAVEDSVDAQELFSSIRRYYDSYYDGKINGQSVVLCHYAMRVWNESHRTSWMLYGHSHGTLDDAKPSFPEPTWIGQDYYIKNSKSMDVGIDTHPEFRPYHFDEVANIMKTRVMEFNVDHHNKKTT